MNILIIDDNQSITTMVSKYLKLKGNECVVSNSGKEGLKMILQNKYDLIILDISMPEFTGRDILEHLEKNGILQEKNIVLFTASAISTDEIDDLMKKGLKGALRKPVDLEDLDNTVARFQK
ncbi:MAG TPA: response regulator [Nitrosarchaeum sp.]